MKQAGILSWCPLSCFSAQDFIKAEPADALRTRVRPLVIITCANLLYLSLKKNRLLYYFYFRLIDGQTHLKWLNYCWHRDLWALNFYPADFFFLLLWFSVLFSLTCPASGLWSQSSVRMRALTCWRCVWTVWFLCLLRRTRQRKIKMMRYWTRSRERCFLKHL